MSWSNKLNGYDADDPRFRIRPYQQAIASVSGALCTSLFMTPMDVVKVRLQVQQKLVLSSKCYLYCNGLMDHICPCGPNVHLVPEKARFNGTLDAFAKIGRNEGWTALWGGLSPTLVLALPTTVLYFVAYEQFRVHLKDLDIKHRKITDLDRYRIPMWIPLVAGCTARCFAVTVVNPLELIRTKMQSEKMSYSDVGKAFKQTINQYGIRGLFKGLFPTIMRDAPFSSIYWVIYESYKRFLDITQPGLVEAFIGGGFSGCIAAAVTTPFDVIKTHQQIEFGEKFLYSTNGGEKKKQMTTTLQTMRNIMRSNGVAGFYAGLVPRLFKVVIACAMMITSYEVGKTFFHGYNVQIYKEKHPEKLTLIPLVEENISQ